jgi:uncharacterized protein YbjT (DUF2867 family)
MFRKSSILLVIPLRFNLRRMVRYLITSGNSAVGKSVIKALVALGEKDIVAGARDVEKSRAELNAAGASEVVHLDLYNVDSLKAAFKGTTKIFFCCHLS